MLKQRQVLHIVSIGVLKGEVLVVCEALWVAK